MSLCLIFLSFRSLLWKHHNPFPSMYITATIIFASLHRFVLHDFVKRVSVFVAPNAVSFSVVFYYFFFNTCFLSFINLPLISFCRYRISSLKRSQMSLELSFSVHCTCSCFGLCGIHLISPHPFLSNCSLLLFSP